MGKALGLLLIVIATGLLIYWFVVPLFVIPIVQPVPATQTAAKALDSQADHVNVAPAAPITPTRTPGAGGQTEATAPTHTSSPPARTPERREQDDLEARRAPYYRWLREQAGDRVTDVRLAADDRSTLVLYTSVDTPDIVSALMRDAVAPAASRYGFRHVRFFVPNSADSISQYRLDAESSADEDGNWHTFLK